MCLIWLTSRSRVWSLERLCRLLSSQRRLELGKEVQMSARFASTGWTVGVRLKEIVDNVLDERDELKSTVVAAKAELHATKKNLAQLFRLVGTIVELLAKFGPQNVTPVLVSLVQFHIVSPVKPSFM